MNRHNCEKDIDKAMNQISLALTKEVAVNQTKI